MRTLADLLASSDGRDFLEGRGVFTDPLAFVEAMATPQRDDLLTAVGLPAGSLVPFTGQQAQCDYAHTVTAKFRVLRDLARAPDIVPITLPLDTDRPGSNRWSTTLTWPEDGQGRSVRLIPHRLAELEMRYAPVSAERLHEVEATVGRWCAAWAAEAGLNESSDARYAAFVAALTGARMPTLAEVNRSLTAWLLRDGLGFEPPIMMVSELIDRGLLRQPVDDVITALDDVISVFNQAVADLVANDVDPKVHPLPPEYLPLWYACPQDGKRCRLSSERRGADRFAVASCRLCGSDYRFHLGGATLSIEELVAAGRWSTDVTLPVYINAYVSGVVAGQSTALYGLVLDEVVRRVLGSRPVPMLVPSELGEPSGAAVHSLLFECLTTAP